MVKQCWNNRSLSGKLEKYSIGPLFHRGGIMVEAPSDIAEGEETKGLSEVPVCLCCFTPFKPLQHFCRHCGETVGQLTYSMSLSSKVGPGGRPGVRQPTVVGEKATGYRRIVRVRPRIGVW